MGPLNSKNRISPGTLSLTPLIDVVFLLLDLLFVTASSKDEELALDIVLPSDGTTRRADTLSKPPRGRRRYRRDGESSTFAAKSRRSKNSKNYQGKARRE